MTCSGQMSIQVVVLIRNQNITKDKTGFREEIKDKTILHLQLQEMWVCTTDKSLRNSGSMWNDLDKKLVNQSTSAMFQALFGNPVISTTMSRNRFKFWSPT